MKLRNKKTGEIIEFACVHICNYDTAGKECEEKDVECRSLEKLLEEWEDYKPAEPLIKDEKIRKAVRAWAEVVGKEEIFIVSYNLEYHDCCIYAGNLGNTATIDFGTDLNIKEDSYTIAELCGEED